MPAARNKPFSPSWIAFVKRQPRHVGLDEIQRRKGRRFLTVLSDVVWGDVIGPEEGRPAQGRPLPLPRKRGRQLDMTGRVDIRPMTLRTAGGSTS
jgi:hypothetical protein